MYDKIHYKEKKKKRICLSMKEMQKMRVPALGLEDPLEEEMATLLQYSRLGNPIDRGAWRAAVHRATESQARLSN